MNDDLRTIQQVLAGDIDAFRFLVERHQGTLFALVGNLVSDTNDRDDIAQEAFLAAYVHLGSYDPHTGQFSTWLLTIAAQQVHQRIEETEAANHSEFVLSEIQGLSHEEICQIEGTPHGRKVVRP